MSAPETSWPLVRLSGQRLAELQRKTAVADRNPYMALMAEAQLLAAGQHFRHARKLSRLLESEYPVATIDLAGFMGLFATAILTHDPELAVLWLRQRYQCAYQIAIGVAAGGQPVDVVIIRVHGDMVSLQISYRLFEFDAGEMILSRLAVTFGLIDAFMKSPFRADGTVALNMLDSGSRPGLAFCECRPGYYLIPDPHFMVHEQYKISRSEFRAHEVAWEDRVPVAYWRGSTTGTPTDNAIGWRSLPRIRLCEIGAANPDIIDAGITGISQISDPAAKAELESRNLTRDRVPSWSYQRHRYQIDIDGYSNAWDGLVLRLLTGSPVLKVASRFGFEQWYYDRLRPWVNFVPVRNDMADLAEKVNWLRANDDAARRIGEAGRALAESLDHREIAAAAPVMAAAIRAQSGAPLIDLHFDTNTVVGDVLQSGWHRPQPGGVTASRAESQLRLPRPPGFGDFVLLAEVSSQSGAPGECTIVANGQPIGGRLIAERCTVFCALPRAVTVASDRVEVTLHFPANPVGWSATGDAGNAEPRLTLHRIGIAAADPATWTGYRDLGAVLAGLNAARPASVVHDLALQSPAARRLDLPSGVTPRTLQTCFGTMLYADLQSGRIRHGPAAAVPRNLFLLPFGEMAILARAHSDGYSDGYVAVGIRPEGPHALNDEWIPWYGAGSAQVFAKFAAGSGPGDTFCLQAAGLFACAEGSGEFTLSRATPGDWEVFHFQE